MAAIIHGASVALIHRDKVLLIQRAREPSRGLWTLPGGRLEPGEDAETAAAREVREELGLDCYALRPIMRLSFAHGTFHLQVFATEAFEGEIVPAPEEVLDHRWLTVEQVARLSTTAQLGEVLGRAFRLFDRT